MPDIQQQKLKEQVEALQSQLTKEKKISKALLKRVKGHLSQYLSAKELYEHNSLLLNEIKSAKKELYQQAEAAEKLAYMASHDSLTDLFNRSKFEYVLNNLVAEAKTQKQTHAVCFLDLDQFKVVNDTAGHLAGDEMLRQLSHILSSMIGENDTLARLGGDEFGLIMDSCDKEQAETKAKEILMLIDKFRFSWEEKNFSVTFSIGITIIDHKSTNHIDALKQADIACYSAKNAGRNRVRLYESDGIELHYEEELLWVPKITDALENNLLCLYAQEIQPVNPDNQHSNYELLVRLKSDDDFILPGAFLPVAERYNLINKIDQWVINNTLRWLSLNHLHFDPKTHFSINLSGQSVGNEDILGFIIRLFQQLSVPTSMINFEITETVAISNLHEANKMIKQLKQYGCTFSLDDFGSGLSSFAYLKNLDVDYLKIDGVFVRHMTHDKIDEAMVASIVTMGKILGKKMVAEYVENESIANRLSEMGIDYCQGYAISKPIPIDQILPK